MSVLDTVYEAAPVGLQNLLLSAKGLQFRMERYGGDFAERLDAIARTESMDVSESRGLQARLLRAFVTHAATTSPYYRELFAAARISPAQIETLDDLKRLPVLEKSTLRARTEDLRSEAARGRLAPMHTSGTTGTPLTVGYTFQDLRAKVAFWERAHNWFGVSRHDPSVRFSGRTLFPKAEANGVFWRRNGAMNQLLMSSYHLHEANLDRYVAAIAEFRPALIDGYPSAIHLIARRVLHGQAPAIRPRLVMTTAETLEDFQREALAEAFQCPVRNQYSSSEGAPFAAEDEDGVMALFPSSGIVEVVRPGTDEPARPGEPGDLLVTSFITHAYPLIRYRIGDTGVVDGYTRRRPGFPRLLEIVGRQEDYILSPERGPVGRLDPVFKKLPASILESQIVQTAADRIELRYVPDPQMFTPHDLELVRKELALRLGDMSIDTVACPGRLARGANGKLRAVVGLSPSALTDIGG